MAEPRSGQNGDWGRELLAGAVLLALVGVVSADALRPPPPRPPDAPRQLFSAGRAVDLLKRLAPEGEPHPVGSVANGRIRARIEDELRRLGIRPEVQATFACGRFGFCARVENVTARLAAGAPGKALLVMAHYDGVQAGPGVSDDLAGVVTLLEVARALAGGPAPPRPLILLFTDGEEGGEIGATAFASQHGAGEIGAAINVDTRGTSGPSLIFETVGNDGWLVRRLARDLPRPVASSVFTTVYRALPADSDLSAPAASGVPGLNFGFIRHAAAYHTALDDLSHLDHSSLQHLGDHVLAMARSLLAADLERQPPGSAVFFDVLGRRVFYWPRGASLPLAGLASLLWLAGAAPRWKRGALSAAGVATGLTVFLAVALVAVLAGLALAGAQAAMGAGRQWWIAHPVSFRLAAWSGALLAVLAAGALSRRRAAPADLGTGIAAGWCLLALGLAVALPGASHLAILPALAFALAGPVGALRPRAGTGRAWSIVPAMVGALLLVPFSLLVEDGAGTLAEPAVACLMALAALPLAPAAAALSPWVARRWVGGLAAATVAAGVLAVMVPAASPDAPEHVVLMFRQDADTGLARWFAHQESGRLPQAMRRAADFGGRRVKPFGWGSQRRAFEAEATPLPLPGPELTVLERLPRDGGRSLRVRVASPRGARVISLVFPGETRLAGIRMQGERVAPPPAWLRRVFDDFQVYRCLTLSPEGVEVGIDLAGPDPVDLEVVDETPGLPSSGAALASARPAAAATYQEGDATYFRRRFRL